MDVVSTTWAKPVKFGKHTNATTVLYQKLNSIRYALNKWSKNISRLPVAIENTNKTLLELDTLEEQSALTTPEANFITILKKHLLRLLSYQKEYWKK